MTSLLLYGPVGVEVGGRVRVGDRDRDRAKARVRVRVRCML